MSIVEPHQPDWGPLTTVPYEDDDEDEE